MPRPFFFLEMMMRQPSTQNLFEIAQAQIERRFPQGEAQEQALLDVVGKTVIHDRLVPPGKMTFLGHAVPDLGLDYQRPGEPIYTIHRHALGQLCAKVSLPISYVNLLQVKDEPWRLELLAHNLNELYHRPIWLERGGAQTRFLHRIVDNEVRGFLSRRYNRHLASAPLLRAFIDICRKHGAKPIEASNSPVRSALKCLLPKTFEVFPGEYICVGVEWSNSDFGAGRLKVLQTVWRLGSNSAMVMDEGLARTHIGAVIEDSDIEMSDETAKKEVEAQKSAIVDMVTHSLSEKTVERMLRAMQIAREEKIPWNRLRGALSSALSKVDIDWLKATIANNGEGIVDLPPISFEPDGTPVANAYWAASAISAIASRTEDADKRLELQKEAGKLLAGALGAA
jgi:hypothetical protein